jgi:hypothetical protein
MSTSRIVLGATVLLALGLSNAARITDSRVGSLIKNLAQADATLETGTAHTC